MRRSKMSGKARQKASVFESEEPSSVDAKDELLDECESIWKQMEECQSKLTLIRAEPLRESDAKLTLLMMRMKALTVEFTQWQKKSPEIPLKARSTVTYDSGQERIVPTTIIISTNPEVLLTLGKEELQKVKKDLEMVLSAVQSRNKKLKEDLEREQQWHDEQEKILDALKEIEKNVENEVVSHSKKRALQKLKDEILKVKAYKEELLNALGVFLEEHFPLPEEDGRAKKKKKEKSEEPDAQLITLHEILEFEDFSYWIQDLVKLIYDLKDAYNTNILINKLLRTPHEPYVTVNDSFWPPYIELLLRWGIALRHPEDPDRIRLEDFHQ